MNIPLSKTQEKDLIESVRADMVAQLLTENRDDLRLLSVQQVSGMLDVHPKTLQAMKLPRVVLIPNKVVKYLMSDVIAFIAANREK